MSNEGFEESYSDKYQGMLKESSEWNSCVAFDENTKPLIW